MGLYDDDNAAVTSGNQNNEAYWYASAYSQALDLALKTRQPEGAISGWLREKVIKAIDEALSAYPAHEDLKKWKARADQIKSKVNPDADYAEFKSDFPWRHDKYLDGWVALNWARCAHDAGDWNIVYEKSRRVTDLFGEYGCQKNDVLKTLPEDAKKLVLDGYAEGEKLWAESKSKR